MILGETYRSSRKESKRRDAIDDQLDELGTNVSELTARVNSLSQQWEQEATEEKRRCVLRNVDGSSSNANHRNDELARILERIVEIGLRGGWVEFQDTPLQVPRIQLSPRLRGDEPFESVEDPITLTPEETKIDVDDAPPDSRKV